MAKPPLGLHGPRRLVGRAAGRLLARRFLASHARANPHVFLEQVAWRRALHSARVLVETASLRAVHGLGGAGHPFLSVSPAAAAHLSSTTGVPVMAG